MALVFAFAFLTAFGSTETVPRAALRTDTHVLAAFNAHIDEYVELHRIAAAGLGDSTLCADAEELSRQSAALAAAIRKARPAADEGEFFTAAVASVLRVRIAKAVRASRIPLTEAPLQDEEFGLAVHAMIRAGVWDYLWAPILRALPDLPPELEYQFVGRHLVLVDVQANLVVDILRYAVPATRPVADIGPADACTVHPELPACWM